MVGPHGTVVAIDLQAEMLEKVTRKATRHSVADRMEFHQCAADRIGYSGKANFILAFYVVHETPDMAAFFKEVHQMLLPGGMLLVVEPRHHVKEDAFKTMVQIAEAAGLQAIAYPKGKGGPSVLLTVKDHPGAGH